nr:hypothetical protein [Chloroflexota bacterium]
AILVACKQIDPNLKPGMLTQAELAAAVTQAQAIQAQINGLELQLIGLRNKREAGLTNMWEALKRARAIVKGIYGDDSSEYELVGGTRMSERKRPVRKQAA